MAANYQSKYSFSLNFVFLKGTNLNNTHQLFIRFTQFRYLSRTHDFHNDLFVLKYRWDFIIKVEN